MIPSVSPPRSTTIAAIEKELRDIWTQTPGEATQARACTMNLVVVASREVADRYLQIVDEVVLSTPARAIVVGLEPNAAASILEGDVVAVHGFGENASASERVRLFASGAVCSRVGSAVEALLVPEIPTALVWLARVHVDDPVFSALADDASRVVLDTEYTSLSSLLQLSRWARGKSGRPNIADLAWTRLAPWQEMCARFFDDPKLTGHAQRIRKLVLRQASDSGAKLGSEGALLLGWFATRLGWKMQRIGGSVRFRRPDGDTVVLELRKGARPSNIAPAALTGVSVEADANGVAIKGALDLEVEGSDAAALLVWKLDAEVPAASEQRVRLSQNKGARMLERTLHRPSNDPALAESALFAEEIYEEGLVVQ
ncbi:MAG: glucose-6-phosphate dehydrogenase assembly protein OpcA [Polyangiaceae bacterium]